MSSVLILVLGATGENIKQTVTKRKRERKRKREGERERERRGGVHVITSAKADFKSSVRSFCRATLKKKIKYEGQNRKRGK